MILYIIPLCRGVYCYFIIYIFYKYIYNIPDPSMFDRGPHLLYSILLLCYPASQMEAAAS